MTKEELKQKAYEYAIKEIPFIECITQNDLEILVQQAYITESREKRIDELEEKISVLLSCKNCPENKGGFICQKEYEDKCLAQKIQYIKELQEEIKNLKKTYRKQRNKRIDELQKENAELKEKLKPENCLKLLAKEGYVKFTCENGNEHDRLIKATKLIRSLYNYCCSAGSTGKATTEAEQFLSEVEE